MGVFQSHIHDLDSSIKPSRAWRLPCRRRPAPRMLDDGAPW
jgi:hypothetical protein